MLSGPVLLEKYYEEKNKCDQDMVFDSLSTGRYISCDNSLPNRKLSERNEDGGCCI